MLVASPRKIQLGHRPSNVFGGLFSRTPPSYAEPNQQYLGCYWMAAQGAARSFRVYS